MFKADVSDPFDQVVPLGDDIGQDQEVNGTKRPNGDEEEDEEATRKPKKAKKTKKARFDEVSQLISVFNSCELSEQDLELEMDVYKGKTYKDDMDRQRLEQGAKGRAKEVEDRANALVDGAGQWVNCKLPVTR